MTRSSSDTITSSPLATSSALVHGPGAAAAAAAAAKPDAASPHADVPAGWRRAGILLHVTGIPGPDGIGDLGAPARGFVEWLAHAGQRAWQPLPMHPAAAPGADPWTLSSAFAGDPMLLSLDDLVELELLPDTLPEIRASVTSQASGVDPFTRAARWKLPLVRQAARQLLSLPSGDRLMRDYLGFCEREAWWLADHVACTAVREQYPGVPRSDWPVEDRVRRLGAHRARSLDIGATHEHVEAATQFLFDLQLRRLYEHATRHDVWLVADVPAFVADDSSDVWAHADLFLLDDEQRLAARAGSPPEPHAPAGEVWQVAPHDWETQAAHGYDWWLRRLRHETERAHILHLDHARTFADWWRLPPRAGYGDQGRWDIGPGARFLDAISGGTVEVVVDDHGQVTDELAELRSAAPLPTARVLTRGLDEGGASLDLPPAWTSSDVGYTGDARTGTMAGWTRSALLVASTGSDDRLSFALRFLGAGEPGELPRAAIEAVMASPARIAMVPFGDWLGLEGASHDPRSRSWVAPSEAFTNGALVEELVATSSRTRRGADA
jgi:4-alpha-glucanotransferase